MNDAHAVPTADSRATSGFVSFPPAGVSGWVATFRPTGVAPATARQAWVHFAGGWHTISLKLVRHSLATHEPLRLKLPRLFGSSPDHHRRYARTYQTQIRKYHRQIRQLRLRISYRIDQDGLPPAPQTDDLSQGPPSASETSVNTLVNQPGQDDHKPPVSEEPQSTPPEAPTSEPPATPPPPTEPPTNPPPSTGTADYFVSLTGSDNNPGTKARPFLSLNKAYRVADPGDTIEVAGGTYNTQQTVDYDPAKAGASEPVTFIATENVHFAAALPTAPFRTNIRGTDLTFSGHFEFDYLYIREDAHKTSNITFEHTWIHHLTDGGELNGLNLLDNRLGPNNLWAHTGAEHTGNTGPDDILDFGIERDCSPTECFSHSVTDLNIVGNNFNGAYHSWNGSHSDCIQFTVAQDAYIADNTFQNCENETLIFGANIGLLANVVIENNYFARPLNVNNPYAIQMAPCTNCTIRFNSVASNGSLFFASGSDQGVPTASGERIYGNIAGFYDGGQCTQSERAGWSWKYNLFIGSSGACGTNAAATPDPQFADQSSLDLQIPTSSAATDFYRGSEPIPTADITGFSRPQGGFPDAGAFEAR